MKLGFVKEKIHKPRKVIGGHFRSLSLPLNYIHEEYLEETLFQRDTFFNDFFEKISKME